MARPKACVFTRSPEKDYNVLVGDSVELRLRIKNCGGDRGNFYSDINKDGGAWISKYNEWLEPGELGVFLKRSFTMPNREVKVDFYGGHAWSGDWSEDFHYTAYLRPRKEYCTQEIEVTTKDGVRVRATVEWGDGTSDSGTTPKTFSHQYEVVIGKSYEIKVSASGYYTESIWLTLPCKAKITSTLPKKTETCEQRVKVATSDGAAVGARLDWGDGTHEDFNTPKTCFYDRYEKGKTYTVKASADGYESASKTITACVSRFTLTLKKVAVTPEYCYQNVRVETSDGKSVTYTITWGPGTFATGTTPDTSMLYCEKGKSHTATATASGYKSASKTFTACTSQFTLTLTKEAVAPPPTGENIPVHSSKTFNGFEIELPDGEWYDKVSKHYYSGSWTGSGESFNITFSFNIKVGGVVVYTYPPSLVLFLDRERTYDLSGENITDADGNKLKKVTFGCYDVGGTGSTYSAYFYSFKTSVEVTKPPIGDRFEVTVTEGVPTQGCCLLACENLFKVPFTDTHAITKVAGSRDKIAKKIGDTVVFTAADGLKVGEKYVINVGFEPPYPFDNPLLCGGYRLTTKTDEFVEFGGVKKINVKGFYDAPSWQKWWCGVFDVAEADCNSAWALAPLHILYAPRSWSCVLRGKQLDGVTSCTPTKWDHVFMGLDCFIFVPVGKFAKMGGRGAKLATRAAENADVYTWIERIGKDKLVRAIAGASEDSFTHFDDLLKAGKFTDAESWVNKLIITPDWAVKSRTVKELTKQIDVIIEHAKKYGKLPSKIIEESGAGVAHAKAAVAHGADYADDLSKLRKYFKENVLWDDIVEFDKNIFINVDEYGKVISGSTSVHPSGIRHLDIYRIDGLAKPGNVAKLKVGGRLDNFLRYAVGDISKDPAKFRKLIGTLSDAEADTIVRELKAVGKVDEASLYKGLKTSSKWVEKGGVYDGITAVGDDLGDAIKAGGDAKVASKGIVDDSLDFIGVVEKDVDEGKIIEKGLKGKFGVRLKRYLDKLSHQRFGDAWDDLRPGQQLKIKIGAVAGVLGYGSFCQFITEESLQNIGWGMGSPFFNKQWDIAGESLEDYKAFHNAMERQMKFCCIFNPLTCVYFWEYIVADREKIKGWERTLEKATAGENPFAGAKGRVLVKSHPSGAKIYAHGIYTNEETNSVIPNLTVGSHVIGVWLDGYIPLQRVVAIEDSKQADCDFGNLPPIPSGEDCPEEPTTVFSPKPGDPQPWGDTEPDVWWEGVGDIDCKTTPTGADIWVDGKKTAFKTNYTLLSQSAGRHTITFKKSGYRNCTVSVTVIANQPIPAYCDMTIIKPTAAFDYSPTSPKAGELVTFDATDTNAGIGAIITSYEWYCDDVAFGTNNIKATKTFAAGSYRIKLRVTNNFRHSDETVKVLTVTEVGAPVGGIKCYCTLAEYCGRNADILVDGNKVDVTKESGYTYIKNQTPGVHTVKYNLLDVMECSGSVTVTADKDVIYTGVLALSEKVKSACSYDDTNFYYKTVKVTKIEDGDSIFTDFTDSFPKPPLFQKGQQVRIAGYDSPDGATARANAKDKLTELIPVGSSVTLKIWPPAPLGKLNRVLAGVFKGDVDIAIEMLKSCLVNESKYKGKDNFPWVDWIDYGRLWKDPVGKECLIKPGLEPLVTDIDTTRETFKINNRWFTLDFIVRYEDEYGVQKGVETKKQVDGRKVSIPIAYAAGAYAIKLFACIEKCDKKENWILVDTGYVVAAPAKQSVTFDAFPRVASVKVVKKETAHLARALRRVINI